MTVNVAKATSSMAGTLNVTLKAQNRVVPPSPMVYVGTLPKTATAIGVSTMHVLSSWDYTLLGIIMTGIKWWVFGNFAILKPVFIFTGHNKYRPLSFWGSQGV